MPDSNYDVPFDRGDERRGTERRVSLSGDGLNPLGYADGNGPGEPAWISGGYFIDVYGRYGGNSGLGR